jgi:hypothetical protein
MNDSIKFAIIDDVDDIMEFIHNNWKENHILSQNKEFFLYQHQDNNRINFVIHRNNTNELDGILGFIKSSSTNSDIWTVIWKALSNKEHPMLGIELFEFLRNAKEYNVLSSPGINKKTTGIYKYLNIHTDHLEQFVLINNKIEEFKIAKVLNEKYLQPVQFLENNEYNLKRLSKKEILFDFEKYKETIPFKDEEYFIKRYFNHPIYKYEVYGILKNVEIHSLLVTRAVSVNNSKVLRIVDFIGDQEGFQFVTKNLYKDIINKNYEYIDFMCFGFDYDLLLKAGFHQVDLDSSDLIIPNYFSPFVSENIQINFFVDTNQIERVRVCKADGDQDRPS